MLDKSTNKISVVIPNWNGENTLGASIDSLLKQTLESNIIVVDNGSSDKSLEILENDYPQVTVLKHKNNKGFAGGVNTGINKAIEDGSIFVALFNNDAVADKNWLMNLYRKLSKQTNVGIVTPKMLLADMTTIDSTGEMMTIWGLPYPRGRDKKTINKYDKSIKIFGASGGASLYRITMLKETGLFDKDFFAYYEDIDLSYRAQLLNWEVLYVPESIIYHSVGTTSGKIKGFTTYQTMKNLPWLVLKNTPNRYIFSVLYRFCFAYILFYISAVQRGYGIYATKGLIVSLAYVPKKIIQRLQIQRKKKVSAEYIWKLFDHDLPPNAIKLRSIRSAFLKINKK